MTEGTGAPTGAAAEPPTIDVTAAVPSQAATDTTDGATW